MCSPSPARHSHRSAITKTAFSSQCKLTLRRSATSKTFTDNAKIWLRASTIAFQWRSATQDPSHALISKKKTAPPSKKTSLALSQKLRAHTTSTSTQTSSLSAASTPRPSKIQTSKLLVLSRLVPEQCGLSSKLVFRASTVTQIPLQWRLKMKLIANDSLIINPLRYAIALLKAIKRLHAYL